MSDFKEDFEIIRMLGEPALMEQLAEECSELAQAALKLARLERGENPTPKTEGECLQELIEEMADVDLCMDVIKYCRGFDFYRVGDIESEKMERWAKRIWEARGEASKEKKKTRQSEFLKMFPKAVKEGKVLGFCPRELDTRYMPEKRCENIACVDCRVDYWLAEVK